MANFLLVLDPDPHRRRRCVAAWRERVGWQDAGQAGEALLPGGTVAWCAGPRAPLDAWEGEGGAAGLVLGDAIDGPSGRLAAREAARCMLAAEEGFTGFDGFHAALAVGPGGRTVVSADPLGLFPVYHGRCGEAWLVSSTPAAFDAHPGGRGGVDEEGLAALLTVHGTVAGRTLLPGVRRLPAGRILARGADGAVREDPGFELPGHESLAGLPWDEQLERLHRALAAAVGRHAPEGAPVGLLLTGGRDSRMLAGYLADAGREVRARTFGAPRDLEARLARRVADRLGIPWDVRPLETDAWPRGMDLQVRLDQLASGADHVWWWSVPELVADLPERTVTGHLFDVVVGALFRAWKKPHGPPPFDQVLPFESRAGVDPDVLARLWSAPRATQALAWARSELEALYQDQGPPNQRVWRWMTALSNRTQLGGLPWRLSFGSWPVLPVLDREVITTAASIDSPSFSGRQGQSQMLVRWFPELARLPHLFENDYPSPPLISTAPQRIVARVRDRVRPHPTRRRRNDPRFNWRVSDFENPGWKAVRRRAEPLRGRLYDRFDRDVLDGYLPGPEVELPRTSFAASKGRKLLLGLALWLEHTGR